MKVITGLITIHILINTQGVLGIRKPNILLMLWDAVMKCLNYVMWKYFGNCICKMNRIMFWIGFVWHVFIDKPLHIMIFWYYFRFLNFQHVWRRISQSPVSISLTLYFVRIPILYALKFSLIIFCLIRVHCLWVKPNVTNANEI